MTTERRRVLTNEEKHQLRQQWPICYVCEEPLEGYDDSEIEWDHIYAYTSGHSQELADFAPLHASKNPNKRNCHKGKGTKSPVEYKEELRIKKLLSRVTELKDLCPNAKPVAFSMDKDAKEATINGEKVRLYLQSLQGHDFYYFFHELSQAYIETDDQIQLRPVDNRITGLVWHLRQYPQLLPSLARLDTKEKKVRVFDGQHKAIAQMIGRAPERLQFVVFVDPDVNILRNTVLEAHTRFVQQRYQPSHIDRKLFDVFSARISEFQSGDPNKPYSEKDILAPESKTGRRQYLEAWIIEGLARTTPMADSLIARTRSEQRSSKPFLYSSLQRFVQKFALLDPVPFPTGHPENHRDTEVQNLTFILEAIRKETIEGKWTPSNPESEPHKLARAFYYDHAVRVWLEVLDESVNYGLSMLAGKKLSRPTCYRPEFSNEEKNRVRSIVAKLFTHGLWLNPANRQILSSSFDENIRGLFSGQGLDSIYCSKV